MYSSQRLPCIIPNTLGSTLRRVNGYYPIHLQQQIFLLQNLTARHGGFTRFFLRSLQTCLSSFGLREIFSHVWMIIRLSLQVSRHVYTEVVRSVDNCGPISWHLLVSSTVTCNKHCAIGKPRSHKDSPCNA